MKNAFISKSLLIDKITPSCHPLPRLIYNPSDSVAIGWYRVDPQGHGIDSRAQALRLRPAISLSQRRLS